MNHPAVPFIILIGLVFAMGNGVGDPLERPAVAATETPATATGPSVEANAYNNGLIGQMIYEMRYDGALSNGTINQANGVLADCQAIKFNHPACQ